MQVGDGGDALQLRGRTEPGHVGGVEGPAHRVVAEPPEQAQPGGDPLQFAGRGAVRQLRHAVDGGGFIEARHLQEQAVDVGDVQAGVVDHHRPGGRDPVEVVPGQARAAEMQRIEAPAVEQLVRIGDGPVRLREPVHDGADVVQARHAAPVRAAAVAGADIGLAPEGALHHVGVPLDEAGEDDLVGEAAVRNRVEPVELGLRPDHQHAPVLHGDMRRVRPRRVHRDDPPGLEEGDLARHGCPRHGAQDVGRSPGPLAPDVGDEGSQGAAVPLQSFGLSGDAGLPGTTWPVRASSGNWWQ